MFRQLVKTFKTVGYQKLPETLFGRSLLILVIPLIVVQIVSIFIFFDRHWQSVLRQLADTCAAQIQTSILLTEHPSFSSDQATAFIKKHFEIDVQQDIAPPSLKLTELNLNGSSFQDGILENALQNHLTHPFQLVVEDQYFIVYVPFGSTTKAFFFPRKKIGIKAIRLYFAWSLGLSIVLLIIAAIFLRNQMRPLQKLAEAVHYFGKGRQLKNFRPAGTKEIRKVGTAFIVMRDRLQRYIAQRTQMLAGVSHDLCTPLTRMKLQLALLSDATGVKSLHQDIQEMERLIKGYLDFARGDSQEQAENVPILLFIKKIVGKFTKIEQDRIQIPSTLPQNIINIHPHSLERCLNNILSNALRYGKNQIHISLEHRKGGVIIFIDDDGPGIPAAERQNVLKPFYRLEKSRNKTTGGIGLGLAIAQDSMRRQGGNILLSDSPLGGLRVQLTLPL